MCSTGLIAQRIIPDHSKSFCSKWRKACYKEVRLPLFAEMPRALQPVEKLDPGTLIAAQTGSRGFKSGFRGPKQAFLNPN
jgi:hypothetical protein